MLGCLHYITDARAGRRGVEIVEAALSAGAPVVQVRVKGRTDAELYDFAGRVAGLCAAHGAACLVNDRVDVAVAVGAAGAHLGEDDLPLPAARRVLGAERVLGASAREAGRARELEAAGATYLGVGPVYATTTKAGLPAPLGAGAIRSITSAVGIPVIAVGGITPDRVPELLAAGAHGVAVVGAIANAADPQSATRALLAALARAPELAVPI